MPFWFSKIVKISIIKNVILPKNDQNPYDKTQEWGKMTNSGGIRRGTRYMFSRKFRTKGMIPLSTYMKVYKKGDMVDIKVTVDLKL